MPLSNRVRRWLHGRDLAVWFDPAYRLPLPEGHSGFEPRRADYASWFLRETHAVGRRNLRTPARASYADLSRVHTPELLDSLGRPGKLAEIFAVDVSDVRVDELMSTLRLVCGATMEAARELLRPSPRKLGRTALNLLGGFHHAGRNFAGGFCAVNDVAIAIAAVRSDGFNGRIAVLDLDAHPPDGTADCLREIPEVWLGSLSGSDFGPLPGHFVDETVLPEGCGDAEYLLALDALLARMPPAELCFVLAGGDVLAGDPLGKLGLTLAGARQRDLHVAAALLHVPSVWLPAGGYSKDAWRVLAGTGLALAVRSREEIPRGYDPLGARFGSIARSLQWADLSARETSADDIAVDLGLRPRTPLLLGFYSAEGIEHALHRYGVLDQLHRLGFGPFRVTLTGGDGLGEKLQISGRDEAGAEHLLLETLLEKRRVAGAEVLYVHWLTLRNPHAQFSASRPRLPGQEVPGLGLAREASELFSRMAVRLGLAGVAYRPANYHTAYQGRFALRFVDPARQGRFEALIRDLTEVPLVEATAAVAAGRVQLDGAPYAWEADEMVLWLEPHVEDTEAITAERERVRFSLSS